MSVIRRVFNRDLSLPIAQIVPGVILDEWQPLCARSGGENLDVLDRTSSGKRIGEFASDFRIQLELDVLSTLSVK